MNFPFTFPLTRLLDFAEAKARILGPTDLHVKAGSSITLTCLINQGPHDLGTVFWYKGDNILETSQLHVNDADYNRRLTIEVCIIQTVLNVLFYDNTFDVNYLDNGWKYG